MAKTMKRPRRYTQKKRAIPSWKSARPRPKITFAQKVNSVINKKIETKLKLYNSNITAFNQQISQIGDVLRIMPGIDQGPADNQRIGNKISISKMNIRGVISMTLGSTSLDNTRLGVRLLILRAKKNKDWNDAASDFGTTYTRLLEQTVNGFTGALTDFNTPINRDYFSVIADKRYKLTMGATSNPQETYFSTKFVNIDLPYHKNRIVQYDEQNSTTESVNYPYFMLIGYTKLSGAVADGGTTTLVTFQYTATCLYKDI